MEAPMTKQPGPMERGEFIRQCEDAIHRFEEAMQQAVTSNDEKAFIRLAEGWRLAQENWLHIARDMSPEKARAFMVGWATGELTKWMEERRPGPPPSVLTHYPDGAIPDNDYQGKNLRIVDHP